MSRSAEEKLLFPIPRPTLFCVSRHRFVFWTVLLLSYSLVVALYSADVAAAHFPQRSGTATVGFSVIVVVSVGLSLLGGIGLLITDQDHQRIRATNRFHLVIGALLSILGVLAVLSAAVNDPILAMLGALSGLGFVWILSIRSDCQDKITLVGHRTDIVLGAIITHRAIEGVALAAVYAAGSAIAVLGAVVLAGHAVTETVAVGGFYLVKGRVRAILAISLIQVGFIVGAIAGRTASIALIPSYRITMLAVIGAILLIVGGSEVHVHSDFNNASIKTRY